jgi:hypothetical protein
MPLTLKSLSGPLTTFEKEGELNMTEEITDKMRELRASQKRTTGLAVLSLAAAGGLGYIFNLSPLLRPDLSENNVASYSERSVRQQISSQFEKTAVDFANFVIETGNKTDNTPLHCQSWHRRYGGSCAGPDKRRSTNSTRRRRDKNNR